MRSENQQAHDAVDAIWPILASLPSEVIGAVLADLAATWLASHQMLDGDRLALETRRSDLFARFMELVRDLVPINEAQMREQIDAEMARRRRPQ